MQQDDVPMNELSLLCSVKINAFLPYILQYKSATQQKYYSSKTAGIKKYKTAFEK